MWARSASLTDPEAKSYSTEGLGNPQPTWPWCCLPQRPMGLFLPKHPPPSLAPGLAAPPSPDAHPAHMAPSLLPHQTPSPWPMLPPPIPTKLLLWSSSLSSCSSTTQAREPPHVTPASTPSLVLGLEHIFQKDAPRLAVKFPSDGEDTISFGSLPSALLPSLSKMWPWFLAWIYLAPAHGP